MRYLDAIDDVLEDSKPVPFSGKFSVDKNKVFDILDEIRLNMPNEIHKAQRIISEQEKIIQESKNKASQIIREAEEKASKLISEHEVYKHALQEANEAIEESKKISKDMRLNAMDYADEILAKTEEIVKELYDKISAENKVTDEFFNKTIDILYSNRMELKGAKKR